MTAPRLPYSQAHGELAYCPDDFDGYCETQPLVPELPAVIEAGVFLDSDVAGAYGPMLRPGAHRFTSEYGLEVGVGRWILDAGRASAWGPMLRAIMPIGCETSVGIVRPGDFEGVIDDGTRIAETSRLDPHLVEGSAPAYGPGLIFHGHERCHSLQAYGPQGVEESSFRKDLYITDMFGLPCVFCPTMFATFEPPCFGCSFPRHDLVVLGSRVDRVCPDSPPHDPVFDDGCVAQPMGVGDAVCVPALPLDHPLYDANWRIACHFTDNSPDSHHCEDCVFQRNLGFLVNQILSATDALSRIPMRPSYVKEFDSCAYGCGKFGWRLWGPPSGLRIPDYLPETQDLKIMEAPCSSPQCISYDGWHESGYNFCSVGPQCDCTGEGVWCTQTHFFRWRKEDTRNRITECRVCFTQRELCDPINEPCDSNPYQDIDDYHNPSSEIVVNVEVHIKITLVFDHWGVSAGAIGCGCCARMGFDVPPSTVTVNLRGDFCGPIPWGNRDRFPGYMPFGGRMYPGRQSPLTGDQIVSPAGTYPRGSCANLFSDQGLYSDDPFSEPPKRCSSWVGDESGDAPTRFWCPPRIHWRWDIKGGGGRWVPSSRSANKHQTAKECWAAQLVKNLGWCSDGSIMFDQFDLRPCDDPNCRRGCSVEEDLDAQGLPQDPCDPFTPRATPWGCGQCQV